MQHTLVPIEERNMLRHEYRIRLGIVACFALSLAGIVGVSSLFPAFFRSSLEEHSELDTIATLQKEKTKTGITQIENELAADNLLLAPLSSANIVPLSSEVQDITALRGNIKLISLTFVRLSGGNVGSVIQGIAPTRESLLAFKGRLEANTPGGIVDLPIAQLAKSKDIPFSIQVTQKTP